MRSIFLGLILAPFFCFSSELPPIYGHDYRSPDATTIFVFCRSSTLGSCNPKFDSADSVIATFDVPGYDHGKWTLDQCFSPGAADKYHSKCRYKQAWYWPNGSLYKNVYENIYSFDITALQCPPSSDQAYTHSVDSNGDGDPDRCYNPSHLVFDSNCSERPTMLPFTGEHLSICKTFDDGSKCQYVNGGDGAAYKALEGNDCFEADLPEYPDDTEQPNLTDNKCDTIGSTLWCTADPSSCTGGLNSNECPEGCGFVGLDSLEGSAFACIAPDENGDGIPDNDLDGDGEPDVAPPDPGDITPPCVGEECGTADLARISTGIRSDLGAVNSTIANQTQILQSKLDEVIGAIGDIPGGSTGTGPGDEPGDENPDPSTPGNVSHGGYSTEGIFTISDKTGGSFADLDNEIADKVEEFQSMFSEYQAQISSLFSVSLSSSGSLPCLGTITYENVSRDICLDTYSSQLSQIGLGLLFLCTLAALFIVFRD